MQLGNGSVPLTNISHLGVAVKDAEKTAQFLSSIWDIGNPDVNDYEAKPEELISGETVRGQTRVHQVRDPYHRAAAAAG